MAIARREIFASAFLFATVSMTALTQAQTALPSPNWTHATVAGPDLRVKITEA